MAEGKGIEPLTPFDAAVFETVSSSVPDTFREMVWVEGFEPPTIRSQSGDSDQTELHPDEICGGDFLRSARRLTL